MSEQLSEDVIVLMSTVHQHMQMEERLERLKIKYKTVVKPRQLGTDCGMALRVSMDDVEKVRLVSESNHCTIFGVFKKQNKDWIKLDIV